MKVGFQVDELSKLNAKTDSTLPLIMESQKRKHKNFCFLPSSLTYKNNYLYAKAREILFKNNKLPNYALGKEQHLRVDHFNYVFIRQDPPYNMEYISSLHLLEQKESEMRQKRFQCWRIKK